MKLSVSLFLFGCLAWTSLAYPTRDGSRAGEPLNSSEKIPNRPDVLVDPEGQDEPINLPTEEPSPVVKENSGMNALDRYAELEKSQRQETQNSGVNRPQRSAGIEQGQTQETQSTSEQPSRESSESGEQNPGVNRPQRSPGMEQGRTQEIQSMTEQPSRESEEQHPEGNRPIRSAENEPGEGHAVESTTGQPTQESTESGGIQKPEGIRQRRSPQSSFTRRQETTTEQPSLETTGSEQLPELTTEQLSLETTGSEQLPELTTEQPSLETTGSEQLPELTTSSPESLPESVESIGMPEGSRQRRHDQTGAEEQQETTTAISEEPVTLPKAHFWQALI